MWTTGTVFKHKTIYTQNQMTSERLHVVVSSSRSIPEWETLHQLSLFDSFVRLKEILNETNLMRQNMEHLDTIQLRCTYSHYVNLNSHLQN